MGLSNTYSFYYILGGRFITPKSIITCGPYGQETNLPSELWPGATLRWPVAWSAQWSLLVSIGSSSATLGKGMIKSFHFKMILFFLNFRTCRYTEEESRGQASFLIRWILIPMIRWGLRANLFCIILPFPIYCWNDNCILGRCLTIWEEQRLIKKKYFKWNFLLIVSLGVAARAGWLELHSGWSIMSFK